MKYPLMSSTSSVKSPTYKLISNKSPCVVRSPGTVVRRGISREVEVRRGATPKEERRVKEILERRERREHFGNFVKRNKSNERHFRCKILDKTENEAENSRKSNSFIVRQTTVKVPRRAKGRFFGNDSSVAERRTTEQKRERAKSTQNKEVSRFRMKNTRLVEEVSRIRLQNSKRSGSQKICRKQSSSKKKATSRKLPSNEKKSNQSESKEKSKKENFSSLSPKVKRRFGSVTVGKVVGKREISKKVRKSNCASKQFQLTKTPLRR